MIANKTFFFFNFTVNIEHLTAVKPVSSHFRFLQYLTTDRRNLTARYIVTDVTM